MHAPRCALKTVAPELIECMAGNALVRFPVFVSRAGDDVRRQRRSRRLLVPADPLEIVAHVLLVERRLRLAGSVLIGRPETRRIGRERFVDPDELPAQQAEFKFRIGDDDASLGGVLGRALVQRQARIAQFSASERPIRETVSSNEIFSSWPVVAFVEGVKIGSGSLSESRSPAGSGMPQMPPVRI